MPPLDLRPLRLTIGDHRRERVPTAIEPFVASSLGYACAPERFDADLSITRLRDGILFDLAFETRVLGPCQRCLDEANLELAVEGREYQADAPETDGESETTPYLEGDVLDVDGWARDAVILALPIVVTCSPGCRGLCAQCGQNRNLRDCSCDAAQVDERWSALRALGSDAG